MFVERTLMQGLAALSILGGIAFYIARIAAIGDYLLASGLILGLFTLTWRHRFHKVADKPPEGYQATGERYWDPGRRQHVAVWAQGLHRIYVLAGDEGAEA